VHDVPRRSRVFGHIPIQIQPHGKPPDRSDDASNTAIFENYYIPNCVVLGSVKARPHIYTLFNVFIVGYHAWTLYFVIFNDLFYRHHDVHITTLVIHASFAARSLHFSFDATATSGYVTIIFSYTSKIYNDIVLFWSSFNNI